MRLVLKTMGKNRIWIVTNKIETDVKNKKVSKRNNIYPRSYALPYSITPPHPPKKSLIVSAHYNKLFRVLFHRCTWWVTCVREPTRETTTRLPRSTTSTARNTCTWFGGLRVSSWDSFAVICIPTRFGSCTTSTVSIQHTVQVLGGYVVIVSVPWIFRRR